MVGVEELLQLLVLAVYLSTSDEALVLMLSEPEHMKDILPLLLSKFLIAVVFGYLVYFGEKAAGKGPYRKALEEREETARRAKELAELSADAVSCGCGQNCPDAKPAAKEERRGRMNWKAALYPAFRRTEEIFLYLFLVTFALNLIVELVGLESLSKVLLSGTPFEPLIAVLIGLIPNCAASVILTQLYFEGVLGFGAAIGGLAAGAGLGLLVLFRVGKNMKANLLVLGLLFVISVLSGSLLTLFFHG